MGREEQIEEREVLDSIFPDEIIDIDEKSYRITINPDVPQKDGEDVESPTLLLTITYPPSYPDEPPILDLTLPPNAPKPPHLDISADRGPLLSSLTSTIEENLGMAMIFTLVTVLRENIESLILERVASIQAAKDRIAEEAEAQENAKFHGERVTRESFLRWREGFRGEMEAREEEERARREMAEIRGRGPKKEDKLTGRELWEKGLVGKVDEDEDVGVEDGLERLKVA
ncbi:MAG: hypothetical protein L6R42_006580 [Xanthoria sp. 1 TBL-2021]|nr:MAG: hypothetical protein L6R42_006580 [Xanthoria sp. 1 TBL-2021]